MSHPPQASRNASSQNTGSMPTAVVSVPKMSGMITSVALLTVWRSPIASPERPGGERL